MTQLSVCSPLQEGPRGSQALVATEHPQKRRRPQKARSAAQLLPGIIWRRLPEHAAHRAHLRRRSPCGAGTGVKAARAPSALCRPAASTRLAAGFLRSLSGHATPGSPSAPWVRAGRAGRTEGALRPVSGGPWRACISISRLRGGGGGELGAPSLGVRGVSPVLQ